MLFHVKVKNIDGVFAYIEVKEEIYQVFDDEVRATERNRSENRRHKEDIGVEEDIISYKHNLTVPSIEETLILREQLTTINQIIKACTPTQQRRFYLNRICGYSLTEIAKQENCSKVRVKKSVDAVSKKIKKHL